MKQSVEILNQKAREDLINLGVPEEALTRSLPFLLLYSRLRPIKHLNLINSLANNSSKILALAGDEAFYTDALKKHPNDLNNDYGVSLAHYAAWSGNLNALDLIKNNKPELLNTNDKYGKTIAHYAAWSGNAEALEWIKNNKPELLDVLDISGCTIAHYAAWSGNPEALDLIKNNKPELLNTNDKYGKTIAHYAAWSGNPEALNWVNTHKPELLDVSDNEGCTIAHYAASSGNPKALEWIKNNKPELLDVYNNKGFTIVHAALSGSPEAFNKATGLAGTPHFYSYEHRLGEAETISAAMETNYELGHIENVDQVPYAFRDNIISKLERNRTIGNRKVSFMSFIQGVFQGTSNLSTFPEELRKYIFLHLIADYGFSSTQDFGFPELYNEAKAFVDPKVKTYALKLFETKKRHQEINGFFFQSEANKQEQVHLRKHVHALTDAIKAGAITDDKGLIAFENPKDYDLESVLLLIVKFFDNTWPITMFIPIVGQLYIGARTANGWDNLVIEDSAHQKNTALRWNFLSYDGKKCDESQENQPLLNPDTDILQRGFENSV